MKFALYVGYHPVDDGRLILAQVYNRLPSVQKFDPTMTHFESVSN